MPEAVIVSATRSPIGRAAKGSLRDLRPDDLTATIVRAALDLVPGLDPTDIDDLYLGCGLPGGEQGFNMGRVVATLLGYDHLPAATLTRYCASSLQTTRMAFHAIKAGEGDVFVSAGVEMVSRYARGNSDVLPPEAQALVGGDWHNPVFAAEQWDAATETWTVLSSASRIRQYHSAATLLPDGRVLTGGGGICGDCTTKGYLEKNIEYFSPPYLFDKDGSGRPASVGRRRPRPAKPGWPTPTPIPGCRRTGWCASWSSPRPGPTPCWVPWNRTPPGWTLNCSGAGTNATPSARTTRISTVRISGSGLPPILPPEGSPGSRPKKTGPWCTASAAAPSRSPQRTASGS